MNGKKVEEKRKTTISLHLFCLLSHENFIIYNLNYVNQDLALFEMFVSMDGGYHAGQ